MRAYQAYPLTRRYPLSMWSMRNTRIRNTRIAYIELINTIPSTMPSNRASNDICLVRPTQYYAQPNRVTKNPQLELWTLPEFKPWVDDFDDHSTPNLPPNLDRQYLAVAYIIYRSTERTIAGYLMLSDSTLSNELYRLFYIIFSGYHQSHIPEHGDLILLI